MPSDNPVLRFGVAGNPPHFWASAFSKERANAPYWLAGIGLDALEIQCTYGVRMPDQRADAFKEASAAAGIALSVHAPYYISLGSADLEKGENSLRELTKAIGLAKRLGSRKVIFHIGSAFGDHDGALERALERLGRLCDQSDPGDVRILPEIDGRRRWLGSLADVLQVCQAVKWASPCLDLAHLHARTGGSLVERRDFLSVLDSVAQSLGAAALRDMHFHMYPIEWGAQGEIGHKAFDSVRVNELTLFDGPQGPEDYYMPRYEPMLDALAERGVSGTVICEAKDSQDVGAGEMKVYFRQAISAFRILDDNGVNH